MSKHFKGLTRRYPAQFIVPIVDIFSVISVGVIAYWWRFNSFSLESQYFNTTIIIGLLVVLLNALLGNYSQWRNTSLPTLLTRLFIVFLVVGVLITSIIYFTKSAENYSRLWIGLTFLTSYLCSSSFRIFTKLFLKLVRYKGYAQRTVYLVGSNNHIQSIKEDIRKYSDEGYKVIAEQSFYSTTEEETLSLLEKRVNSINPNEVWICVPMDMGPLVRSIFYTLRNHTAEIRFIPEFQDMQLINHRISEVAGHYAIDLSVTPMSGMAQIVKSLEDIIFGLLISILILPICLVIAIAIKITSPGPILFKQCRTGANGKKFNVYKFRSMKIHQESEGTVTQATKGDPRLTSLGAFLRRTSLDELPQFLNVLQGRMSIVGPRPHALAHNEYYKDLIESYMRRHKVKPGITGWAQVNGLRGETDTVDKMSKRVEYDLWYIDNWSVWLDLRIIFLTILKGFINKNAY